LLGDDFRAEIINRGDDPQRHVPRFSTARRNATEHSKTKPPIRAGKNNPGLAANPFVEVRANPRGGWSAIAEIDGTGNKNRFVVNVLSRRRRLDQDLERG
jgi:hypothetical protein